LKQALWAITSRRAGKPTIKKDVVYELEQYPEDKTERDLEKHVAPAIRHHMLDLLAARNTRGKPVADIEQGYISTASCILANMSMALAAASCAGTPTSRWSSTTTRPTS